MLQSDEADVKLRSRSPEASDLEVIPISIADVCKSGDSNLKE